MPAFVNDFGDRHVPRAFLTIYGGGLAPASENDLSCLLKSFVLVVQDKDYPDSSHRKAKNEQGIHLFSFLFFVHHNLFTPL